MNQSHAFPQPQRSSNQPAIPFQPHTQRSPWIAGHANGWLATRNRILIAAACWPAAKPRDDDTMRSCTAGKLEKRNKETKLN
jgi:hypothetical protein